MIHKLLDSIVGDERVVEADDLPPSVVVLALLILRENAAGKTEILLSQEKKTDALKRAGDVGWAGAETSRVIGDDGVGVVEGLQSTIVSSLGEEVLAHLGTDQSVEARYVDMGEFWYKPGVLARLASVQLQGIEGLSLDCRDGETTNLQWVEVDKLSEIHGWRSGMEDSPRIIPMLAALDNLVRNGELIDGLEVEKLEFNGETLNQLVGVRSTYPDTKSSHFAWRSDVLVAS